MRAEGGIRHLVTVILLLVSLGAAMPDDVLQLRRIVPVWQSQKNCFTSSRHMINAGIYFNVIPGRERAITGGTLTAERTVEAR